MYYLEGTVLELDQFAGDPPSSKESKKDCSGKKKESENKNSQSSSLLELEVYLPSKPKKIGAPFKNPVTISHLAVLTVSQMISNAIATREIRGKRDQLMIV